MKQPTKTEPNIYSVDLSVYNRPSFEEGTNSGKRWITRGIDNLFPIYLIDLYNQGNTHGAVVDGKISYGVGRGLFINPEKANMIEVAKAMQFLKRPNPFESWDALIKKTWTNFEIHNSYAFEILRNQFGKPIEVYNIDIDRIAEDRNDSSIYLYSLEWETKYSTPIKRQTNLNPKLLELPKYDPKVIHDRSILVHYEPRPGMKHYSLPPYINALEAIEEEIEIAQFHLNNVKNGFVGGTMVNFLNGNATDAEKDQIEKRFNAKFANGNGSKILYNFADGKDQAAEVLPLQPNTLDKQFELRAKAVPENIIIGHRAVSGMLFGIKTEGQLGGRNEILESYELFKETYVKPRQDTVLGSVNKIFEIFGLSPIVDVKELKPLAERLPISEITIAQIVPKEVLQEYIMEMYGIVIDTTQEIIKSNTVDAINALSPLVANKVLNNLTPNELRSLIGLPAEIDGDKITPQNNSENMGFSDTKPFYFDSVGENADNYEEIECHHVEFNDDLSPIFKYNEAEFIKLAEDDEKTTGTTVGNIPKIEPKTPKISPLVIKYRYGLRPDAPALQSESRDFCQKMMSLNKLYTKQDIEGMKNDMDNFDIINNSNVWLYRGGWYRDPNKEVAVPFCRHIWNQVVVRQK